MLNGPLKGNRRCKSLAVLGKFIFHETTALPLRRTSFTQNWKQFRQGLEQQGNVMRRKGKFCDCNADELSLRDTRKKCQNFRLGLSRIFTYINRPGGKTQKSEGRDKILVSKVSILQTGRRVVVERVGRKVEAES